MPRKTLYPHQQTALDSITDVITKGEGNAAGRIIMPTGGGKTFVEAALVEWQMANNSKSRIHLVLSPRILLTNQLIKEFREFSGPIYRAVAFHSDRHEPDYSEIKWQETATTSYHTVKDEWGKAQRKDMDLVVFSTYHSCGRLKGIDFDTIIADESQYCVAAEFNDSLRHLTGRVRTFFTATEKHTSSVTGRGLNNKEFYGERLYEITPAELVKLGLIVPPIMHIMHGTTKDEASTIVDEVIEIARVQDEWIRPKLGFSKILFAMNGTKDVARVVDDIDRIKAALPNHTIFTITAKTGAMEDGMQMRRVNFINRIKTATDCLIFHYDILSEGIDVDGITGVALLRNMGVAKLQQTIGRAVRVYKPDPDKKTNALISIPVLNGNEDDKENIKFYVNAIRMAGYDISYEMVYQTGDPRHMPEKQPVEDAYGNDKSTFNDLFLRDVMHEIEKEWFWKDIKTKSLDDALDELMI